MAIAENETQPLVAEKAEMRRIVDEQYKIMGVHFDSAATAELAQQFVGERLQAHGIKPEDNIFSRGIIAAREEE